MPYVLPADQQKDGETPREVHAETSDYEPAPGELVYSDGEYEEKQGWVWDEANQSLRPRTEEEVGTRETQDLKEQHKKKLAEDGAAEIAAHLTFPVMGLGDREILMIVTTALKQVLEALGVPVDERIALVASAGAATLEAVNRVDAIPDDAPDAKEQILSVGLGQGPG